jgi:hypothetical protein
MRHPSFFGVLLFGLLMAVFNACTEPRDFSSHLRALDSLQTRITSAGTELNAVVLFPKDTITSELKFIEENFRGTMELAMAKTLLRAGSFRDQLQQLEAWKENLNRRSDHLKSEMTALNKTLTDRATHDANNAEVTTLYADSLIEEIDVAQQFWHTKVNEWIILETQLNKALEPLNDSLMLWVDSLQQAYRK